MIDWSLYAILDKEFVRNRSISILTEELIKGGATVVQLRNKFSPAKDYYEDALLVKEITGQFDIPLIINDRLDIALAIEAEGVHLGQKDLPIPAAKKMLGDSMIIGASVHNLAELERSVSAGADYLGVGTIYSTRTKDNLSVAGVEIIAKLRPLTHLPMVAIGGIKIDNLQPVIQAGADGVAVISALLDTEDVYQRTKDFSTVVKQAKSKIDK